MLALPAHGTPRAEALLQRCPGVDLHADAPFQVRRKHLDPCGNALQAGPQRLTSQAVQTYAVFVTPRERWQPAALAAWQAYQRLARCPQHTRTWLAIEGGEALGGQALALRMWATRGLKVVGPVWNHTNTFADAARDRPRWHGLSPAGQALVRLAGELHVLVDVSHASDEAARAILAQGQAQVVATHSNARAVVDHPRNLPDDLIRAIAQAGGVIGLNAHCPFAAGRRVCTTVDLVRHVQHVRQVGGDAVLALGLDLDGDIATPTDLQHAGQLPNLVEVLLAAQVPEAAVCALLGDNVRRLARRMWGEPAVK